MGEIAVLELQRDEFSCPVSEHGLQSLKGFGPELIIKDDILGRSPPRMAARLRVFLHPKGAVAGLVAA